MIIYLLSTYVAMIRAFYQSFLLIIYFVEQTGFSIFDGQCMKVNWKTSRLSLI